MIAPEEKATLIRLGEQFVKSFHRIYRVASSGRLALFCAHHSSLMQERIDDAKKILKNCQNQQDQADLLRAFFTAGGLATFRLKSAEERWTYHRFSCDVKWDTDTPISRHLTRHNLLQ